MDRSDAIAKRLKLAREQAGLSQSQVAKMMNLHRPTVSEMEAGRRKITADELTTLAKIFDVRVEWLACAEEETNERRDRIEMAARKLSKMKPEEIDRLLDLLSSLRQEDDEHN